MTMMVVMVALRFINFSHIDGDCGDGEDSECVVLHKVKPPHCQLLSYSTEWQSRSVLLVNNVKHEMTFLHGQLLSNGQKASNGRQESRCETLWS